MQDETKALAQELAKFFSSEVGVRQLLQDARLPTGKLPPWGNLSPESFWREVLRELEKGPLPGGGSIDDLICAAAGAVPASNFFRDLCGDSVGVTKAAEPAVDGAASSKGREAPKDDALRAGSWEMRRIVAFVVVGVVGIAIFVKWPAFENHRVTPRTVAVVGFEPAEDIGRSEWLEILLPELLQLSHLQIHQGVDGPQTEHDRVRVIYDLGRDEALELSWEELDGQGEAPEGRKITGVLTELPDLVAELGRHLSGQRVPRGERLEHPDDPNVLKNMRDLLRQGETVALQRRYFPELPTWPVGSGNDRAERVKKLYESLPAHPSIQAAAAEALFDLGYELEARGLMKKILESSIDFRLHIRTCYMAQWFQFGLRWDAAAVLDQGLWPKLRCPDLDHADHGFRLTVSLLKASRVGEAKQVIDQLDFQDARVGLLRGEHDLAVGEVARAIEEIQGVAERAPEGSLLRARAHLDLGRAYRLELEEAVEGEYEETFEKARDALHEAARIFSASEHVQGEGEANWLLGVAHDWMGLDPAEYLEHAEDLFAEVPNPRSLSRALQSRALGRLAIGAIDAAAQEFERSRTEAQTAGDQLAELNALFNLVGIYNDQGWLEKAQAACGRADALKDRDRAMRARLQQVCGRTERLRGDFDSAEGRLEDGQRIAWQLKRSERAFWVTQELLDILLLRGQLKVARTMLEPLHAKVAGDSLLLARYRRQLGILESFAGNDHEAEENLRGALEAEIGEEDWESAAFTRLALARHLLGRAEAEDGMTLLENAEVEAQQALEVFKSSRYQVDAWRAQEILGRIELRLRTVSPDRHRARRGAMHWPSPPIPPGLLELNLPAKLIEIRQQITSGSFDAPALSERLEDLQVQAGQRRWRSLDIEVQLAMAELELARQGSLRARALLEPLGRESIEFGLLRRRALRMLSSLHESAAGGAS